MSAEIIHFISRPRRQCGSDDETADQLRELHQLTFFNTARVPDFDDGHWWLAFRGAEPVAFAGVIPSTYVAHAGYLCRVGVITSHVGNGLQLRLTRALERRAHRNGWDTVVSDTTDNVFSANNFIRAGYRMYEPTFRWGWPATLYWRKKLR